MICHTIVTYHKYYFHRTQTSIYNHLMAATVTVCVSSVSCGTVYTERAHSMWDDGHFPHLVIHTSNFKAQSTFLFVKVLW